MSADRLKVLVVIAQPAAAAACQVVLAAQGLEVVEARDGARALAIFRDDRPDVVVLDLGLTEPAGTALLDQLGNIDSSVPRVVLAPQATLESAIAAIKLGAFDFLPLPFTPDELASSVARAVKRRLGDLEAQHLKDEKEALERNFITFVTHQLRSPLVAMAQFFEVLVSGAAGGLSDRQSVIIDKIYCRLQEQLDLINNWLDLSRVKAGVIVERLTPMQLGPFLDRVHRRHLPLAEAAGVRLVYLPAEGEVEIRADAESLFQAVANLLTNAIKYSGTPERAGEVTLKAVRGPDRVEISVEDNGFGIPREFIPFLFDEFSRGRHNGKKLLGTGLGLALARRIITDHGGSIEVRTTVGRGATFIVVLPLERA